MIPELKDDNKPTIRLEIVVGPKVTDRHWDSVECPLGKLRYMSWSIITDIHHTTSHDPDTRLQLVMIRDLPYERLADSDLDQAHHTELDRRWLWSGKLLSRSNSLEFAQIHTEGPRKIEDIHGRSIVCQVSQDYRLGPVCAADEDSAARLSLLQWSTQCDGWKMPQPHRQSRKSQ